MAIITLRGQTTHTCGELPRRGQTAPAFTLLDNRLQQRSLDDFAGQPKLIYTVPSLDTPVCDRSTRTLVAQLKAAGNSAGDIAVLVISADLPFAQQRFCKQHQLGRITTLSLLRHPAFGRDYGVLITDGPLAGLLARALLVLDGQNTLCHAELVAEIGAEPDYPAALAALTALTEDMSATGP